MKIEKYTLESPPDELKKLIGLLVAPEVSLSEVDKVMGWEDGHTRGLLKKYPLLRQTVKDGKVLALKAAGLEKSSAYRVYAEKMSSEDGHVAIKAADRVLTLYGDSPTRVDIDINKVSVSIDVQRKEMILKEVRAAVGKGVNVVSEQSIPITEGHDS